MNFNRREIKKNAFSVLKEHYLLLVIVLLIAMILGTSTGLMHNVLSTDAGRLKESYTFEVLEKVCSGNINGAMELAKENMVTVSDKDVKIGVVSAGHKNGIFAELIDKRSSGSFIVSVANVILNIVKSPSLTGIIVMILALLIVAIKSIFIEHIYAVILSRVFLESRIYKKTSLSVFLFLIRTKKWIKASLSYLRHSIYYVLWCFTIVGGIIKHYSYFAVRFILAENPDISGKEAISLSRKMMDGHKWELFLLDLSFLGWDILNICTAGILGAFFLRPYKQASYTEYYVYIRGLAKAASANEYEVLNDKYLYEIADTALINEAYSDVLKIMNEPNVVQVQPSKIRQFFQNVFGVVLRYDSQEMDYRRVSTNKALVGQYKRAVDGFCYPVRLSPIKSAKKREHIEQVYFMRHYSLTSLILIFFAFCFVGWIWEVSIHIVEDGVFVNRGVLHGPWLPIYGTGAILILLILNQFRSNPLVEFISAITLCGFVEYSGSYALEKIYNTKWWDYTGYFLNINGRICAEGLMVFGLAGIAAVYFVAPMLDNCIIKIKEKMIWPICIVLLSFFIVDLVYSHSNPNTGKGITDYGESKEAYTETKTEVLRSISFLEPADKNRRI